MFCVVCCVNNCAINPHKFLKLDSSALMKKENKRKESLSEIINQILNLLDKHKLVDGLVAKQDIPKQKLIKNLVNKQNLNTLMRLLNDLNCLGLNQVRE